MEQDLRVFRVPQAIRPFVLFAFVNAALDSAFYPLLVEVRDDFGLTGAQTGLIAAAPTLCALPMTLVSGQLAARFGARRVLLVAALVTPVALLAMALAPSFGVLLAARVLFGVAFATNWSVVPAVAASRIPGTGGTGPVIALSGLAWLVVPVLSGTLGAAVGWRVPLLVAGIASIPIALPFMRPSDADLLARSVPLRATIPLLVRSRPVAAATAVSALLGLITGAVGVLVPTVLGDRGIGPSGIGLAFAASAAAWAVAAAASTRVSEARIGVPLTGAATAILAAILLVPVLDTSIAALYVFLVAGGLCRAFLGTLVYPLALRAVEGEAGAAAISGLMNLWWAIPAAFGPIAAGALQADGHARTAFAGVFVAGAVVAVGLLLPVRRATRPGLTATR